MNKTKSSKGLKLAILAAALAVSGVAVAVDGAGTERFHDRAGHHQSAFHHGAYMHGGHSFHHGKGMHGKGESRLDRAGLIVPGYGVVSRDFVDGMGLNADQLKLVEDARQALKASQDTRKDRAKAERQARRDLVKSGSFDPEQALKQADERREQAQNERRKIDEKWIAVWKSLDSEQQARVADHMKQRAERVEKRIESMKEHKKQRESARADRAA